MYEKYVVKSWEEKGYQVPHPYTRTIKHLFAPDRRNVEELMFTFAIIPAGSQTDKHEHDRGELIYVVTGRGQAIMGDEVYQIEPDVVFWVPREVKHQVKNVGEESIKLATVFVPAYKTEELKKPILGAAEQDRASD